ncbi:MAG: putative lyase, partial [uncultured Nocardioidaceae bacterium]
EHHHSLRLPPAHRSRSLVDVLPRRPRVRGPQRRRLQRHALAHRRPCRPAGHVPRAAPARRRPRHHRRRAPHDPRADREGQLRQRADVGHRRPRRPLQAAGRQWSGRPAGADRPAVRRTRLRVPRPDGQPDPHQRAGL